MGTAANPFKCGKGSACPDKGEECRLWHPPEEHLPQFNQEAGDVRGEVRTYENIASVVLKGGKGYKFPAYWQV